MSRLNAHEDRLAFENAVASAVVDALAAPLTKRGTAVAALAGGSTPAAILPRIFAAPLDWPRVTLTVTDERQVPETDPLSNLGQLKRQAAGTPAQAAQFIALEAGQVTLPLDLVWAGVGDDGHTLSWFRGPDLDACFESDSAVVPVRPYPLPAAAPVPRMTLTLGAVRAAPAILLAATGAAKRRILEAPGDHPVARLLALPQAVVHWAP